MKLIQHQKDLIIGTLLGDGSLRTETNGRSWCYRAVHKKEHLSYLTHKFELLKDFCSMSPQTTLYWDDRTQKHYERCYFNTNVNTVFRFYGNLFYKYDLLTGRFVKQVPVKIEKFLTPRAIAYWYMDDGSLKWLGKSNAMRLCTENFTLVDVNRLRKVLYVRYSIETQLVKKELKNFICGYRIAINEKNSEIFRNLIKEYLVPVMCYKVSDGQKGHL